MTAGKVEAMTLPEFVSAVQDETCFDDQALIKELARANWPDVQEFKPVQVRLLAGKILRRDNPRQPELRL